MSGSKLWARGAERHQETEVLLPNFLQLFSALAGWADVHRFGGPQCLQ
jgi:hypothetical protein